MKKDRLHYLAYLAKDYKTITDIGCDHGLLIKYLFKNYNINYAIAVDNKQKPLDNAYSNLKDYNVDFVLSNGFDNINKKTELVSICGIGGLNIINILKKAYNTTYLLEAHSNVFELRNYLFLNNFNILDEYTFFENNVYYVIIKARLENEKNNYIYNKEDIYLGPVLKNKKEALNYYYFYYNHYNDILKNINIEKNNESFLKISYLKDLFFKTIKKLEK